MKINLQLGWAGLAFAAACSVAMAAPVQIASSSPSLVYFDGAGSDGQSPPSAATFAAGSFTGYKVTSIEWWGGYILPAQGNAFTVKFNGQTVTSNTSVTQSLVQTLLTPPGPEPQIEADLYRYSIDTSSLSLTIRDLAATSDDNELAVLSTLSQIGSDWYWQYAEAGSPLLSYRIMGEAVTAVPEPSSVLLVALAGFGLLATRRRPA